MVLHTTTQLAPDLWEFNEGMAPGQPYVDSYLLIGTKRAALIDALQSEQDVSLVEEVRSRTDLPVDVLITHGHGDHAGPEIAKLAAAEGFTLYMSHLDLDILKEFGAGSGIHFQDIKEGDSWDLGNRVLTAHRLQGHTPGSFAFLDAAGARAFTGDAFGLWMQLPHSLTVAEFLEDCRRFEAVLAELPEVTFYTGHLYQCGEKPWTTPHCTDLRVICEKLLDGSYVGEEMTFPEAMKDSPIAKKMAGCRVVKYKGINNFLYREEKLR